MTEIPLTKIHKNLDGKIPIAKNSVDKDPSPCDKSSVNENSVNICKFCQPKFRLFKFRVGNLSTQLTLFQPATCTTATIHQTEAELVINLIDCQ